VEQKNGCLYCSEELIYSIKQEKQLCIICKNEFDSNAKCKNGHFICDNCHSLDSNDFIENYCVNNNESINPIEQAIILMKNPKIKAHGPEHHFLFPAVLINSYYNAKKEFSLKKEKLETARKRASSVPGGYCGFYGACGAGVGNGIFISTITNATPLSKIEWKLANLITGITLTSIAQNGGPRCCKRDGFIAITEAVDFVKNNLGIALELPEDLVCDFNKLNKECLTNECKFYK
jgi:hypothetical protein